MVRTHSFDAQDVSFRSFELSLSMALAFEDANGFFADAVDEKGALALPVGGRFCEVKHWHKSTQVNI